MSNNSYNNLFLNQANTYPSILNNQTQQSPNGDQQQASPAGPFPMHQQHPQLQYGQYMQMPADMMMPSFSAYGMPNPVDVPLHAPQPSTSAIQAQDSVNLDSDSAQPAPKKVPKKRKSLKDKSDEEQNGDKKDKKAKIGRACDSCRRKKIRCDPVLDADPPICKHCQNHNFTCTWFLPITETRWKKTGKPPNSATPGTSAAPISPDEDAPVQQSQFASNNRGPDAGMQFPSQGLPPAQSPFPSNSGANALPSMSSQYSGQNMLPPPPGQNDPRLLGPTSISHLMHSTSTFPIDNITAYNSRHSQTWDIKETGDGFIKVFQNNVNASALQSSLSGTSSPNNQQQQLMTPVSASTIEQLVNAYLTTHAPLFPVLSRADFLITKPLDPLLLWNICGVAAMTPQVPEYVLRTIKMNIALVSKEVDQTSRSEIQTIQALLMFAVSGESERGMIGTKVWNSLGLAIRMAQDLGLHREADAGKGKDRHHLEMRRRLWGGCLIADRWISAIYGLPMMIDLTDCDRLYPSVHEFLPDQAEDQVNTSTRPFLMMCSMIDLSIHLGSILKLLYSPSGIMGLKEEQLYSLHEGLDNWQANLPEQLKFKDPQTASLDAGFLQLAWIPVKFLSLRPFMLMSYSSEQLNFHVTVGQWMMLCSQAQQSIEFADRNPQVMEGWMVSVYSLFMCALIQYHTYVRQREDCNLQSLRQVRDLLRRSCTPETIGRKKVTEVISILEHTAVSTTSFPRPESNSPEPRGINPTAGARLRAKDPDSVWEASREDNNSPQPRGNGTPGSGDNTPAGRAQPTSNLRGAGRQNSGDQPNRQNSDQRQHSGEVPQVGEDPNNVFTFGHAPFAGPSMPNASFGDDANQLETFLPALTSEQDWSSWLSWMGMQTMDQPQQQQQQQQQQ